MSLLTIDKAGRVVIPKPLRDELHLQPGDSLEMEALGDKITLRPVRGPSSLYRKDGIWVVGAKGSAISSEITHQLIAEGREHQDAVNLGHS